MAIDPANPSILYATTRGGVFKSADGGRHWFGINVGLGPHFLGSNAGGVSLSIDPRNPSTLYAYGPSGGSDAFLGKLDPSGSAFSYLTYLGGADFDAVAGLALDAAGNAYATGSTGSIDFPVGRAFQPDKSFPGVDMFVTKLSPDGRGLFYSTYIGGASQDVGGGIAVDRFGGAYVVGYSLSPDFPLGNSLRPTFRVSEGILSQIFGTKSSQPAPTISDVSPSSGSSNGEYAVTILGANFLPGARVRIGGTPLIATEVTSNRIRGVVSGRPTGMVEPVDVVVSNLDGQSTVLKNGFTYLPFPRIDGFSLRGKELAVFGAGFEKGSVILVDGRPLPTRVELAGSVNDVYLLSKKAAKKIVSGQTAVFQVSNVYGFTSAPVSVQGPLN